MIDICEKPNLVETIQNEGIELRQRGQNYWTICPFHVENTASLKIDAERQLWYCHSCGKGGDVISFIRHFKSVSFIDAIKYLGIKKEDREVVKEKQRERERIEEIKRQQAEHHDELFLKYRTLQKAKQKVKTLEDLDKIAEFYHAETKWIAEIENYEQNK